VGQRFLDECGAYLRVRNVIWLYYDGSNFMHIAPAASKAEGTVLGTTVTEGIGDYGM